MPAVTLITAPTLDPVSLAEAKSHCRIDIDDDDGLIVGYILAARQHVETETRRVLMTQTLDAAWDYDWPQVKCGGVWRNRIVLPRPPLQSVTSVKYNDTSGVEQTLAADQYRVKKTETSEWYIEPAYGVTWPSVRNETATIVVRFVAGYGSNPGDIPEALRQAMLLLIGHYYENREAVNVGNSVSELPLAASALIFPHRVFY